MRWVVIAVLLSTVCTTWAADKQYAVHLESRELGFHVSEIEALRGLGFSPYVVVIEADARRVERLRVGPFDSIREAHGAMQGVAALYPDAWVVAVNPAAERAAEPGPGIVRSATEVVEDGTGGREAFEAGSQAAAAGDFDRAVAMYTKATRIGTPQQRRDALELLGVAREYKGQEAHAKALYERYLMEYPDSPDTDRVRQRLAALVTRHLPRQRRLEAPTTPSSWDTRGFFSQFYRRYAHKVDGADEVVSVDALFTDLDTQVRRRGTSVDAAFRLSGSHIYDFANEGSDFRTSSAYIDMDVLDTDVSVRLGRQSRHAAGILGRFDGLFVDYALVPWLGLGAVGGYAVRSSFDAPNTDRPFYGVSATFADPDDRWQLEPFIIEQRLFDVTDRRALGAEARYYGDRLTAFSLLDYDIYHDVLNNAQLITHLDLDNGWRVHGTADYRRSPYLTTENALIGQGFDDLTDLEREYADREILDLANDRTATVRQGSIGVDKAFAERFQWNVDVSVSDYSETQASGDVAAIPARTDVYYLSQLRVEDLFGAGSFGSLQLRYVDGETSDAVSTYLVSRFMVTDRFRVYPRLRYDVWDYHDTGQSQTKLLPSLRLEYRWPRVFSLELEVGHDWTRRELVGSDLESTGYFVRVGYRSLF